MNEWEGLQEFKAILSRFLVGEDIPENLTCVKAYKFIPVNNGAFVAPQRAFDFQMGNFFGQAKYYTARGHAVEMTSILVAELQQHRTGVGSTAESLPTMDEQWRRKFHGLARFLPSHVCEELIGDLFEEENRLIDAGYWRWKVTLITWWHVLTAFSSLIIESRITNRK
jgi:hypothetical protein